MRIFKYWAEVTEDLEVGKTTQKSTSFGGSNTSVEDAKNDARKRLRGIQEIILGRKSRIESYEANILEEIVKVIDQDNIITRNRYGALILNCKNLMFIDADQYPKTLLDLLFRNKMTRKELTLAKVLKVATQTKYAHLGFRVYETSQGYRIIVTNQEFDPRGPESDKLMKAFKADRLYGFLCRKQNCYRARLTPKPYRIKQKGIKVIFPNRSPEQEALLRKWISEYNLKLKKYSVCKLIEQIGSVNSHERIIEIHDQLTGIDRSGKLA